MKLKVMIGNDTGTNIGKIKFIAMIGALILLNLGLFFLLFYFTPIFTGLVGGFFLASRKNGSIISFISAITAYIPLFTITQIIIGDSVDLISLLLAASIMGFLSLVGGFIGGIIGERSFHQERKLIIN